MTDDFKIKFRGVRGSYPTASKKHMQYGGNTPCVEVNVGGHLIILDAGTGLIDIGNELLNNYISSGTDSFNRKPIEATILLSHIHQDHIQGFTFFRPSHIPTSKLNVFGSANYNETLEDELAQLLFTKSFPLDLGDIAADMCISDLSETECIVLKENCNEPEIKRVTSENDVIQQNNDVIITCYKSFAHPQEGVMVYKIAYKNQSLIYATDKESYQGGDKKLSDFARNCDLLIHDAQYTTEDYLNAASPKQGYGHSTFDMAVEAKKLANAKKVVFFHFDPTYDDEKLSSIEKQYCENDKNVVMAYEGLEISID